MLNLGLLAETKNPVVHCREKWQAESLIREFETLLPGKVNIDATRWWGYYKDQTCYHTDIRIQDGRLTRVRFKYCIDSWYENNGYTVLEFGDVVFGTVDLGEFQVDVADINNLFCAG